MTSVKWFGGILFAIAAGLAPQLAAQVQTDVPPPVAGAKPVTVEHIKVHGAALEGNLEGDAADRDVFVFLPPSYSQEKSRRYPVVYALHGYSIGAEQWSHEIHVPADDRRRLRARRERNDRSPARFEDPAQRFHVFEFRDDRRFRAVHRPRPRRIHRRALPHDSRSPKPRTRRPLDGRLRRYPHWHEAFRRVRQFVHHESVLLIASASRLNPEIAKSSRSRQNTCGFRKPAVFCARHASFGCRMVSQPEESAALSRPAHERRSAATGRSREMGCERATRFHGSVHRRSPPVSGDLDRCR